MRRTVVAWAILVATLMLCACSALAGRDGEAPAVSRDAATRRAREFQKGVAFTGYSKDSYVGAGARRSLRHLRAAGATWVEVLVVAYQRTMDSTTITYRSGRTPSDATLRGILRYAHGLGLKVMLKPHVDPLAGDTPQEWWRGGIGHRFGRSDWAAWFSSYHSFIVHYARMAQDLGVEQFCVGCELNGTVTRESQWREVIAAVRAVYGGPLTYADVRNPGQFDTIKWWDAVDIIGMDAYPTLSTRLRPTTTALRRGWVRYVAELRALSVKWGKPVLITEIGCRSVRGAALRPWDWQRRGPVDLVVQQRWYAAALRELIRKDWLVGMYWWEWYAEHGDGGAHDSSFTPHRKPAEQVLRGWYARGL